MIMIYQKMIKRKILVKTQIQKKIKIEIKVVVKVKIEVRTEHGTETEIENINQENMRGEVRTEKEVKVKRNLQEIKNLIKKAILIFNRYNNNNK